MFLDNYPLEVMQILLLVHFLVLVKLRSFSEIFISAFIASTALSACPFDCGNHELVIIC